MSERSHRDERASRALQFAAREYNRVDGHGFGWWLAEHDRQVKAEALQEAAEALVEDGRGTYWRDDSPFHADGRFWTGHHADWIRDRADQIAREAGRAATTGSVDTHTDTPGEDT